MPTTDQSLQPTIESNPEKKQDKLPCKKLKVTADTLAKLVEMDSFKMFIPFIDKMAESFTMYEYTDCVEITNPSNKEYLFVVMMGSVILISSETAYLAAKKSIWKARRQIKK